MLACNNLTQSYGDLVNSRLGEGKLHTAVCLVRVVVSIELRPLLLGLFSHSGVVEVCEEGGERGHQVEENRAEKCHPDFALLNILLVPALCSVGVHCTCTLLTPRL